MDPELLWPSMFSPLAVLQGSKELSASREWCNSVVWALVGLAILHHNAEDFVLHRRLSCLAKQIMMKQSITLSFSQACVKLRRFPSSSDTQHSASKRSSKDWAHGHICPWFWTRKWTMASNRSEMYSKPTSLLNQTFYSLSGYRLMCITPPLILGRRRESMITAAVFIYCSSIVPTL